MERRRIRIHPAPPSQSDDWGVLIVAGLGVGLAAGFLLGEFFGGERRDTIRSLFPQRRRPRSPALTSLIHMVEDRLSSDTRLARYQLGILPIARDAVELHGWVNSRRDRAYAARLGREAAGPRIRLVDCLLVRGEDDLPLNDPDPFGEQESA